ncbi:MAG: Rieske 2Fe-2S domain-containing protein [Chloroflexi bacterium]|nr:Rieske 2Fe-2S domain-containing protein [Chloroflexota bacterium]
MNSEPGHVKDFPFQRAADGLVTRREYLKLLALTSFGLFLGNLGVAAAALFRREKPEPRIMVASVRDVPEGRSLNFDYPTADDPAILVHLPGGRFVAYSQKCTHLACAVYLDRKTGRLHCPCHDGFFDVETGQVLAGPPPRPLPGIELSVESGDIYALREKKA